MNRVAPREVNAEAKRFMQEIEKQKALGKQNFEAVYGSKQPVSLVVSNQEIQNGLQSITQEDLQALEEYVSPEEIQLLKNSQKIVEKNSKIEMNDIYVAPKNKGELPMTNKEESFVEEIQQEEAKDTTERLVNQMAKDGLKTPAVEYLKQCKAVHGELFVLPLHSKVYIYRFLKRQEWSQLNIDPTFNKLSEIQQSEIIFDKCLIWPQLNPIEKASSPAGLTETIVDQIKLQSCFLNPNAVAELTFKL